MSVVLAIDDDSVFLDEMERMLVSAGYDVLRAATGTEGLAILEKRNREISLAVVDLALPGVNGFELIGALSRRPNAIKIIATSAVYKDQHLESAAVLGADAVIRKPAPGRPLPQNEWLPVIVRLIGNSAHEKRATAGAPDNLDSIPKPNHGKDK